MKIKLNMIVWAAAWLMLGMLLTMWAIRVRQYREVGPKPDITPSSHTEPGKPAMIVHAVKLRSPKDRP